MKLNVEDILTEWKRDSIIDESKLSLELTKTPMLHSKYLEIYMQSKAKLISHTKKYNKLRFLARDIIVVK